jgi:hypothetical protein
VEATLEQANKLLMHYGCRTALGTVLQTSLELLAVDLGLSFQPFQVSYTHFGDWVTTLWLKRVWEKVSFFGFKINVNNLMTGYLWEGDDWLMSQFIARGHTLNELVTLIKCKNTSKFSSSLTSWELAEAHWTNGIYKSAGQENAGP